MMIGQLSKVVNLNETLAVVQELAVVQKPSTGTHNMNLVIIIIVVIIVILVIATIFNKK